MPSTNFLLLLFALLTAQALAMPPPTTTIAERTPSTTTDSVTKITLLHSPTPVPSGGALHFDCPIQQCRGYKNLQGDGIELENGKFAFHKQDSEDGQKHWVVVVDKKKETVIERRDERDVTSPAPTPILAERTPGTPITARADHVTLLTSPAPLVGESNFSCAIQECRVLSKWDSGALELENHAHAYPHKGSGEGNITWVVVIHKREEKEGGDGRVRNLVREHNVTPVQARGRPAAPTVTRRKIASDLPRDIEYPNAYQEKPPLLAKRDNDDEDVVPHSYDKKAVSPSTATIPTTAPTTHPDPVFEHGRVMLNPKCHETNTCDRVNKTLSDGTKIFEDGTIIFKNGRIWYR